MRWRQEGDIFVRVGVGVQAVDVEATSALGRGVRSGRAGDVRGGCARGARRCMLRCGWRRAAEGAVNTEDAVLDPFESSAVALARALRSGEVTSEGLVDAAIRHIEAVNPQVNAVVAARYGEARAEARLADARLSQARLAGSLDALPPFLGVPCTVKESFEVRGMPNTAGLLSRRGVVAERDAVTVRRLRDAGAIVLGVTNTSELCMWMESSNRLYGRTSNPYDLRRIVGGSSGGEGAAVGAAYAPFGLGADVGGSIRMPAFFNGVFGHKATGRLIPNVGQYPLGGEGAQPFLCTGPLCRRAEDLMPLVRLMAGPDPEDGACVAMPLGDPESVSLEGLRVVHIPDDGRISVSSSLRKAQDDAVAWLRMAGAQVETCRPPELRRSVEIWGSMLEAAGGPTFRSMLEEGRDPISAPRELLRWATRRSPHTLPALMLAILEELPSAAEDRAQAFIAAGASLRARLEDMVGENGVFLYPSHARPAPRHVAPLLLPWRWAYTAVLNVMEVPVTQVPLGLDRHGRPLGVQVGSRRGDDHRTIAVAQALERAFGGWVPPWRSEPARRWGVGEHAPAVYRGGESRT